MESTHEEKLKSCKSQHMKWLLVVLFGMIPILITGMYMCINVKDIQLLESQSGIIFTIFGVCGLTCAIGMIESTYYSNKESALIFEETIRRLDAIVLKVKENKKMKTNISIPHLEKVGLNKSRFFAFIEIARHPDGMSIGSIAEKIGESLQATQFTISELQKGNYIRLTYEKRDSRGKTYCFATPFGIDNVCKEMESVCRLMAHVRKEMVVNDKV